MKTNLNPIPKIKLLSLTNIILEYRIPVYNMLAETYDLTVAHYGMQIPDNIAKFKQISLTPKKIGSFIIFEENINEIASNFDSVLAYGDLHFLSFIKLGFLKNRKYSLTFWSIGVSASYNKQFDFDKKFDALRFRLMNRADSIVFYTSYPIKRYIEDGGIKKEKLFVANNTVEIKHKIEISTNKKYFLFVGTLYKIKKIFTLLEAYEIVYKKKRTIQPLIIIGEGLERENIENWILERNLAHKIELKGSIFDQELLKNYYAEAIACISPGQAGLTVLNAMAYGVPFVTSQNAITGGEIFNITNRENGIIYDEKDTHLSEILEELSENADLVSKLSHNSQQYYFNNRTISVMVQGIKDAVNYALDHHNKKEKTNLFESEISGNYQSISKAKNSQKYYPAIRKVLRNSTLDILGSFSKPEKGIHILNGHMIHRTEPNLEIFTSQLTKLQKLCTFIKIEDAVNLIKQHRQINDVLVSFTFDDGFEECSTMIAPALEQFGVNALFFINPNFIDGDDQYIANFTENVVNTKGKKPLSWNQAINLAKNGHILGSHTMDHKVIRELSLPELEYQIINSKKIIEGKTGVACEYFAFPFGTLSHADQYSISFVLQYYEFVFSQSDYKNYFSYNGKVLNRRHFEPYWPIDHVKYFLSHTRRY